MFKNSDAPSSTSSAWDKEIDDIVQCFEAGLKAQREELFQAIQKCSEIADKTVQRMRESLHEAQQKQNETIFEISDHFDANKHTGERMDTQKIKPIPEALIVAAPAKPIFELRSPPENFQPSSPKQVCSKQEVTKKIKESNLFVRMKDVDKFRKEPLRPAPQQKTILSKPYVPPAQRVVIKEDKWYVQEGGKAIEITASRKRNMQRRFGRAKRTLEALGPFYYHSPLPLPGLGGYALFSYAI